MPIIAGQHAWEYLMKSENASWSANIARFSEPLAIATHKPKFVLGADDSFFCIGSCFARNVEEHLIYRGQTVLSKRIICPAEEWPTRANGFVNKFTTNSILNEIEWTINPPIIDHALFEETASGWSDLQLAPGVRPVSLERAINRRAYLLNDYFSRLQDASVVILTLGLNEVWHDAKSGRYLNAPPSFYSVRREPQRYSLEISDVAANVKALERIRELLVRLRPSVRLIVTVSPVPMGNTFSGKDVAVANTLSKATLRVAAETFARDNDDVDYFPTFDMISLSPRSLAYGADCLHVADSVVRMAMREFLRLYLGKDAASVPFNELAYLAANPDVEAAVRLGNFSSGFEHWLLHGRDEGRILAPAGGPTELMIAAGASPDAVTRALPPEEAVRLGAGDAHYRAYVGPPDRFDFMSATQFALLFSLGLRDHHAVLDFGCGSLRLGRLLIPYLQAGRYFGIDPNRWLIHDALSRETGWSIVAVKKPTFAYNDDFRCDVFNRCFDFVVAQSIITHCGRSLAKRLLHQFARILTPDGVALFSIIEAAPPEEETAAEGWVYPGCVPYHQSTIEAWCAEAGLAVVRLPWFHPGAVWYASALSPARLPAPSHMTALSGAVLFDPQFRASWPHGS
jgi:SAM-dependent methyltransferase